MIQMALCIKLAVRLLYNIVEGANCYGVWIFLSWVVPDGPLDLENLVYLIHL
jgi:hypothetical protein